MNRITQFLPSDELFDADEQPAPDSFTFEGHNFDPIASLQWNVNRWYDPQQGQWLSKDPIEHAGGQDDLVRTLDGELPNALVDGVNAVDWSGGCALPLVAYCRPSQTRLCLNVSLCQFRLAPIS